MKRSKKGFTLAELLVVVAIIAVLVAIAIPTFGAAKEKANQAVDSANVRSWYAEQVVAYLTDNTALPTTCSVTLKGQTTVTITPASTTAPWTITVSTPKLDPSSWTATAGEKTASN